MKRVRKFSAILSTLVFTLMMNFSSYTNVIAAQVDSKTQTTSNKQQVRLQDDFYDAVNSEWFNAAKISEGKSTTSIFDDTDKKVTEQTRDIINHLLIDKDKYKENSDEMKIINVYNNVLNTEARNREGLKPVQGILDKIKEVQKIDDITKLWSNKEILNSTIKFSVNKDIKNVTRNALYIDSTGLSLGDSDEYTNPTELTVKDKKLTEEYYNKILILSGYTKEEAKIKVENMFKFEGMIAPYITPKKKRLTKDVYNVYTVEQLNELAPNLNLPSIMKNLGVDKANKIILEDPKWLQEFNKIYTQENLYLITNYIEIVNLTHASSYLTEEFDKANKEYENNLFGINGSISKEEDAINIVNYMMGHAIGKIYAKRYVPEKTKEDVENITKEIIETYKERINNLDWMSKKTKQNAINKLDKIGVKIGYPEKWADYSALDIKSYEDGGSLFQNMNKLIVFATDKMFSKVNQEVTKDNYTFMPQTVNAFYDVNQNSVIIPGGIIQGHFYDPSKTREENLGGIGTVIGHEISHAFDNTGAQYDADGNLNNWWNENDYKKFKEKAQKIADFYSQINALPGEKIDGVLTVGENIADIGGVSCLLDILGKMDKPDYKKFFQSYAVTWRQVATKEYEEYALGIDVHSPNKFRVNAVLPQFQKFYDTYGITEKDGMYVKPEDRVGIW